MIPRATVWQVAAIFFRIGVTGFGGPFVAIAMMEEEFVRVRRWVSAEKFAEFYAICKLLPGPIGPQMAIAVARECSGPLGGLLGGVAFIFPAFVLVVGIAAFYQSGHELPKQGTFLKGIQIGALGAIAVSVYQLFRPMSRQSRSWLLATLNAGATFFNPAYEPLYILGTGLIGAIRHRIEMTESKEAPPPKLRAIGFFAVGAGVATFKKVLPQLFWICFKSGAFVFGTGLAILPLLENDFVIQQKWITHSQFMDSIAIGQVTPGPFTISVAFVGYLLSGMVGALTATVGIFLPAFINVLILVPLVWRKFSRSPSSPAFIAWALPAVVGCIFAAGVKLGRLTVSGPADFLLLFLSMGALLIQRPVKIPSWAVILLAGLLNLVF